MADLTHDDVQKILKIIDEMGDRDVYLEFGDLKLQVSRSGDPMSVGVVASAVTRATPTAPADSGPAAAPKKASVKTALEIPPGHVAIRAPTMEIFYRASSPGAKPHAEVGAFVGPDDTVGVFEVMKLFSTLKAGVAGTVTAIPAANEALVAQDEVLVIIAPAS